MTRTAVGPRRGMDPVGRGGWVRGPCPRGRVLCALAGLALAAGLALPVAAARLTLGLPDLPHYAPLLIADERGLFAAEGLDLRVEHCVNGNSCLKRLTDGEIQLAAVVDVSIVLTVHAGARFDIVAVLGHSPRGTRMVARTDHGIRVPADLVGKRIGYVKGSSGHYFTHAFLLFHGIDPNRVTQVPLDPADAPQRLARGEVDAAGLYQPHGHVAQQLLGARAVVLPSPRLYTVTANLVSAGVGDADLHRLLRAVRRAEGFMAEQPQRTREILARRLRLDPRLIDAVISDFDFRLRLDQSLIATLEAESRWALREGLVAPGPMPDYLERIRSEPLRLLDRRAVHIAR